MIGKLYVGNLPANATAIELQTLFATVGAVKWADVAVDLATKRCRGFGFVQMASDDAARRAVASINGRALNGRFVTVTISHPNGTPTRAPLARPRSALGMRRGYRAPRG